MLEDIQKIRLLTAAVNMQNIIATLDIDLEYQALIDLYGSRTKTLLDEVQALEDVNAEPRVAGDFTLQSQLDDGGDLFTSLNQTICQINKLIVQNNNLNLNNNLNITAKRRKQEKSHVLSIENYMLYAHIMYDHIIVTHCLWRWFQWFEFSYQQ